jgi:hypothetical protein
LVTTLEQVVRRGRRRVRGQRLGVLATVVAVLAAAAGGALALWGPRGVPGPVEELATTYQWPEPLAGWSLVGAASCTGKGGGAGTVDATILPRETLEPTFVAGVAEVTGGPANLTVSAGDQLRAYVEVEVPVAKAWASVHLEATRASSRAPAAAADSDVGVYGVCSVPLRKTLATGTVLQLYAPDERSPLAPVQHLRTYLPNGRLYVVSSMGWSRADVRVVAGDPGGVVQGGRGRLPLDSQQLADVATRIADLG